MSWKDEWLSKSKEWAADEVAEILAVQINENSESDTPEKFISNSLRGYTRYLNPFDKHSEEEGEFGLFTDPADGTRIADLKEAIGDPFAHLTLSFMTQGLRDLLYMAGWLAYTAPAALLLPLMTYINGLLKRTDPMLRPALRQHHTVMSVVSTPNRVANRLRLMTELEIVEHPLLIPTVGIFDVVSMPLSFYPVLMTKPMVVDI